MIVSNSAQAVQADSSFIQSTLSAVDDVTAPRSLTALERVELALDAESYEGFDGSSSGELIDGLVTATGRISGTPVCVFSQEHSAASGGLSSAHLRQIVQLQQLAAQRSVAFLAVFDGQAMALAGGLESMQLITEIARNTSQSAALSVALVVGENTGFNALLASVFDVVVMTRANTSLTMTDAAITGRLTGAQWQESELGGWDIHAQRSGLADIVCDNEVLAIRAIRQLFRMFTKGKHRLQDPAYCPAFDTLIPKSEAQSYDVSELLSELSDERAMYELQKDYAPNLVTGITRIQNIPVGIVASRNAELAGVLDSKACRKALRLLRLCEKAGLPVITFVDVPGFLPGEDQEHGGIAGDVAELMRAYSGSTVPTIRLVIGKALGAAGVALGSRGVGPHVAASWTDAQMGLLGSKGAESLVTASDPLLQLHQSSLQAEHALQHGYVDELIAPGQTRQWLAQTLSSLKKTTR